MFQPDLLVMTVSVLLLSTGAQAQGAKRWKRVERGVSVSAGTAQSVQRLRLAPNVVTTVLFDSAIVPEAVDLEGLRELFSRLELQANHLVLKPRVAMPGRGMPPLVVRFADASVPQRLVLELTTEESEVDSVVEVLRQPATAEQLEAELVELRGRYAALEERLATARRPALPSGFAAALLSGAIGDMGVIHKLQEGKSLNQGVEATSLHTYRSSEWAALVTKLYNPPGSAPWVPGLVRLTPVDAEGRPTGDVLEAPVLMKEARLAPGQHARAVVQWRLPEGGGPAAYEVELLDATRHQGPRWKRVEP